MPISPRELLALADSLSAGTGECEWRCSVSRSYYAAIHTAEDVSADPRVSRHLQDTSSWGAGYGTRVIRRFSATHAPPLVKAAGYMLEQLRRDRVTADYRLELKISANDARAGLLLANKIVDKLQELKNLP